MYQRPISGIREGSIGAIIYFGVPCLFFEKKKQKEKVCREMTRRYWNINLEEMMEAGVHFDHGTRKWNSFIHMKLQLI